MRIVQSHHCTEKEYPCVILVIEALRSQTIHFLKDSNSASTERQADEYHVDSLPPINIGCKENLSLMNELISEFKIYLVIYNIVIKVSTCNLCSYNLLIRYNPQCVPRSFN